MNNSSVTNDSISMRGSGVVFIKQPAKGHRFTLDSVLLADFCRVKANERVLEPGAGTGIISLLLAKKYPRSNFYPVEIQDKLYNLINENYKANSLDNVIPGHSDIRRLYQSIYPGHFDVLVTNPPYIHTGTGRTSADPSRKIARQDLLARIEFWLDLQKFLKQGGRYNIVFPANRLAELLSLMRIRKLEPKRMRMVHPYIDRPAYLILMEAVKGGRQGLEAMPPLIVHEDGGGYTEEVKDIYGVTAENIE